jgi:uncharacterized Zn finger protein (UPF0148 family)
MTDLSPAPTATVTCPACGAQNARGTVRCVDCGTALDTTAADTAADADGDAVELEEAWRAAGAAGYDTDLTFTDGEAACPNCGASFTLAAAPGRHRRAVRDTATNRDDLVVLTLACPQCGALGRVTVTRDDMADADADADAHPFGVPPDPPASDPSEVEHRTPPPEGATAETPLGADRRFFEEGGPGTLAARGSLLDEQGEDIRQYTGEPVETEEGWVIPQQQNFAGKDNIAGGGEFPDPNTPSAMPKGDEPKSRGSGQEPD